VFLRFGSLGPKILPSTLGSEAADAKPILVDNPLSPLDVTDLVFVDPTDTGFSHTLPGVSTRQFNSIDGDSEATTQLVINWLRVHHRLDSPVYIYGESYGSMRAVAMTRDLARSTPKIVVAGLMIGGNSLGYFQKGQMPDILYEANALPMMASVAWHYGKIDNQHQTWEQAVDKARFFARTQYISALIMGFSLDSATRENVIRQLPDIIGIPESYFRKHNTIVVKDFCAELLRDSGLVIDRDNGLRTMPASAPPQKFADVIRRYGEYMDFYAANELGVVGLGGYQTIHPDIVRLGGEWNYLTAGAMALDVTLATVMKENPKLRFMMTQGRYDTLTTLGNSEYIIAQTDIPLDRYTEAYYDAGHSLKPLPEVMTAIHKFIENR
jgi:carboxypeptidase C (cathepsin A)